MKGTLKKLIKGEKGQALILALILLAVGGLLIVVPLLVFMNTGLMAAQTVEERMYELYAADAGIEDAANKILIEYAPLESLGEGATYSYSLTDPVNGKTVSVDVTKISLVEGFEGDVQGDQPHEGWISFDAPVTIDTTDEYVEYSVDISFHYTGGGNRRLESIGTFFGPHPGDTDLIDGPYDIVYAPVITDENLEAGSPELLTGSGGFAFVWRWQDNEGPLFFSDDTGSLGFKFKVWDPGWEASIYYIWATVKEQDVSYVTDAPGSYNWLVEASAGDTTVRSYILELTGVLDILTWEVNQ